MRTSTMKAGGGFSLIELIVALVIASSIAVLGIRHLRPSGQTAQQRSCDLTRQLLQRDAKLFQESTGRMPSTDLRELATTQYSGIVLPTCPTTGESYRRDRTGVVGCPTHEATR